MAAYDLKREHQALYAPKNTDWEIVEVPEQHFIAVDGRGDPNTAEEYTRAVEALYAVAYTIKFASKRDPGGDFVVAPLEGLWWSDDPKDFTTRAKQSWQWTMMICQPDWITASAIAEAESAALAKKRLPALERVYHKSLHEGSSAQALHLGSYDDEGPILAKLHQDFLPDRGFEPSGLHHEIYLGDPRKTDPEQLRTVLRQPVRERDR